MGNLFGFLNFFLYLCIVIKKQQIMEKKSLSLSESLERYFNETPQEQLDKDWEELKHWNNIGPDAQEYIEFCKHLNKNNNDNGKND